MHSKICDVTHMRAHASAETAPLVKYVSILHNNNNNNNKIKRLATAYRIVHEN
jgi:4-hydroxy-3-methylbut-2-enyl diphosphate reductase IspH